MKSKYIPHKYNPNIKIDVSHEENQKKHLLDLAKSRALDPEGVRKIDIQSPIFSHFSLVVGACMHTGGVGTNDVRAIKATQYVNQLANGYFLSNGDDLDIAAGKTSPYDSKMNNQNAVKLKKDLYMPIKKKIIGIIGGNHDAAWGSRNVGNNANFAAHLADAVGVPYSDYGILLNITMPISGNMRYKKDALVYLAHMSGRGGGKAKSVDETLQQAINRLAKLGSAIPDVVIGAHFHANSNGKIVVEVPVYAASGKLIGTYNKEIVVVSESTLQENSPYAVAGSYKPADSNMYINDMRWVKNPLYRNTDKNEQPEYTLEFVRIPMFKKDSDMFTQEATDYLAARREPIHLKQEISKEFGTVGARYVMETLEKLYKNDSPKQVIEEYEKGLN